MGIHDRHYYDRAPSSMFGTGGSLGGRLRTMSVNGWLIAINVVVFLLGNVFFANIAHEIRYQPRYIPDVTEMQKSQGQVVADAPAQPVPNTPLLARPIVAPDGDGRIVQIGDQPFRSMPLFTALGHFSTTEGFFRLSVWRLLTFQFLHANFMHIFFNMFGLWVFGGMVEQHLGRKRYLAFYLICGIAGALTYLALNLVGMMGLSLPGALEVDTTTPLVGASAGVFGVIMACARISPESRIQLLFPPIPLKMKFFAFGYLGIAALNLFFIKGNNQGGDAAHVGGALAGFYFIRNAHLLRDFFDVFGNSNLPSKGKKKRKAGAPKRDEVDRILDKVSRSGIGSLSSKEKKILREASESDRSAP